MSVMQHFPGPGLLESFPIRKPAQWFHGGPRIPGEWVLPPRTTGVTSTSDLCADVPGVEAHDRGCVYVVNDYAVAVMFAAVHRSPWVYIVEPEGELADDPDFNAHGSRFESKSCARAFIRKRIKPSRVEVASAIRALLHDTQGGE